ncbi:MAG TPA: hypothetical protein VKB93_28260 [Thermoanaerobaculia bacterium]|nr:hypothetical protein [Thermoanaerobaculia bacterium]
MTWRLPVNVVLLVDALAEAEGITTTAWVERAITNAIESRYS